MSEESYEHWYDYGPGSEHANRKAKESLRGRSCADNKMSSSDIEDRLARNLSDRLTLQHQVDKLQAEIARLRTGVKELTAAAERASQEIIHLRALVDVGREMASLAKDVPLITRVSEIPIDRFLELFDRWRRLEGKG